jgi:putative transposase
LCVGGAARQIDNQQPLGRIKQIHSDSRGTVGAPRMYEDLANIAETASKNKVARLMAVEWLQGSPRQTRASFSCALSSICTAS